MPAQPQAATSHKVNQSDQTDRLRIVIATSPIAGQPEGPEPITPLRSKRRPRTLCSSRRNASWRPPQSIDEEELLDCLNAFGNWLEKRDYFRQVARVPRKIRQLVADLEDAGFVRIPGGKGSHRKFRHSRFRGFVLISGADGDDAQHYQEKQARNAGRQVQS
jgi:predicted RNA binding protein YcfA (HicA-like mRNA interferase family)